MALVSALSGPISGPIGSADTGGVRPGPEGPVLPPEYHRRVAEAVVLTRAALLRLAGWQPESEVRMGGELATGARAVPAAPP